MVGRSHPKHKSLGALQAESTRAEDGLAPTSRNSLASPATLATFVAVEVLGRLADEHSAAVARARDSLQTELRMLSERLVQIAGSLRQQAPSDGPTETAEAPTSENVRSFRSRRCRTAPSSKLHEALDEDEANAAPDDDPLRWSNLVTLLKSFREVAPEPSVGSGCEKAALRISAPRTRQSESQETVPSLGSGSEEASSSPGRRSQKKTKSSPRCRSQNKTSSSPRCQSQKKTTSSPRRRSQEKTPSSPKLRSSSSSESGSIEVLVESADIEVVVQGNKCDAEPSVPDLPSPLGTQSKSEPMDNTPAEKEGLDDCLAVVPSPPLTTTASSLSCRAGGQEDGDVPGGAASSAGDPVPGSLVDEPHIAKPHLQQCVEQSRRLGRSGTMPGASAVDAIAPPAPPKLPTSPRRTRMLRATVERHNSLVKARRSSSACFNPEVAQASPRESRSNSIDGIPRRRNDLFGTIIEGLDAVMSRNSGKLVVSDTLGVDVRQEVEEEEDEFEIKIHQAWERKVNRSSKKYRKNHIRRGSGNSLNSASSPFGSETDTSHNEEFGDLGCHGEASLKSASGNEHPLMTGCEGNSRRCSFYEHCWRRLVLRPGSRCRVAWDMVGITLIGYDLIWIPLQAFAEPNTATAVASFIAMCFWTIDIPVSFFTGFLSNGVAELRPSKIAQNYMRGWLSFDVVVVSTDWTIFSVMRYAAGAAEAASGTEYTRIGQMLKFFRLMRLVRLLKADGVISDLIANVRSEFCLIILGLTKRLVFILVTNHLIACAWFAIGNATQHVSWVESSGLVGADLGYQYFTSLHWSLTQFTPASMEVVPENVLERGFTVAVLIFAMVMFSSFVSAITMGMTRLQNLNSEQNLNIMVLRRYLSENKVSGELTSRIWDCLRHAKDKSKRRLHQEEIKIIPELPQRVRADLCEEVYAPLLTIHPFFHRLQVNYHLSTRKIFQVALHEVTVSLGREVFLHGEASDNMYFVVRGTLVYNLAAPVMALPGMLQEKQWACEPTLWIQWKHRGQLTATTHCELIALRASKAQEVLKRLEEPVRYAREFASFFGRNPHLLTDVWNCLEVMQNMSERAFSSLAEEEDDDVSEDTPANNSLCEADSLGSGSPCSPSPLPGEIPCSPSHNESGSESENRAKRRLSPKHRSDDERHAR